MIKEFKTIISIDPGYERLGVAILKKDLKNKVYLEFSGCFKTSSKLDFSDRILLVGEYLEKLITKYRPETLAIENLFLTNNQKTAMRVAETRGAILYVAKKRKLDIYEMTPSQIKSAVTGNGQSDKISMEKMIKLLLPELSKVDKKIDDEYDAIACGLSYFALEKSL
ncbi:MAG: crossover junction endodeoxyribonuclease RuvC, crossover junction endodeoxyribonuclease RuvC [Candidatus Parcubacteria bacterium]|jgi:crossover junction endodeoxyribonuclease RuvC